MNYESIIGRGEVYEINDYDEKESAASFIEKEMVALGISITIKCIPCMLAHITSFKKAGGTREQLVDVVKTCILMNGGPGTAYGAKALAMYDELD